MFSFFSAFLIRLKKYVQDIKTYKHSALDIEFNNSNDFIKSLVNCFEFLICYYDSEMLWEDFIKLPGGKRRKKTPSVS